MVSQYQSGVIGPVEKHEHDMTEYHRAMEDLEFNKALDEVWQMIRSLNQYIDSIKPWVLYKQKSTDTEAEGHLSEALSYCVGSLIQIADLLVPFLPATAASIHETFSTGVIKARDSVLFAKKYLHTTAPNKKA